MVLASVVKESGSKLTKTPQKAKTFEIEGLELDEVSAVDTPANQLSLMALWKRASKPQGDDIMNIEELTKRLEDTESQVETLTKAADAAKKAAEARMEALTKALGDVGVTVAEKDGAFSVEVEKAAEPEYIEVDGEKVLKSSVPAPLLKQLQKQAADIKALQDKDARVTLSKRAEKEFPHLGGTPEQKAELVKMLDNLEGDAKSALEKSLKAADAAVAKMFDEVGNASNEPSDVQKELDAMVSKYAEEKSVSKSVAFAEVTKSGKGRELLVKTRSEAH